VVGPFTRPPSHYWDLQEAGLDFKEKSTQLADLPKTCLSPKQLSGPESYYHSQAFRVALESMTSYSRGVACQFVELVTRMSAAIAALDAMNGNHSTILTPPVEETKAVSIALQKNELMVVLLRKLQMVASKAPSQK
jgi:hypothetical protein